jgi:hypothetical protein
VEEEAGASWIEMEEGEGVLSWSMFHCSMLSHSVVEMPHFHVMLLAS